MTSVPPRAVFSLETQARVREQVLDLARADPAILGAAITGSCARGEADRWSDVDLFFQHASHVGPPEIAQMWTQALDERFGVAHYFDVHGHGALYRAFLLTDVVEVDIGFADEEHFRGVEGKAFDVVFRRPESPRRSAAGPPRPPDPEPDRSSVGHAWHHLIHARIGVERSRPAVARRWTHALREVVTELTGRRPDLSTGGGTSGDLDALTAVYLDDLVRRLGAAHPLVHAVTRVSEVPWSRG